MKEKVKFKVADEKSLDRTITRLAHEIVERCRGIDDVVLVGIRTRGEFVARRIAGKIEKIENVKMPVGVLDVVLYRDDIRIRTKIPKVQVSDIPFGIDDKTVILIDDVIYTGRTVRAALDALVDYGRPAKIQLAVLVDRGNREMPIKADYVGINLPVSVGEEIRVKMREVDGEDGIFIVEVVHESQY